MTLGIRKIMMTTDLSDASWHALGPAVRWARQLEAELTILQVCEMLPSVPVTMMGMIPAPPGDVLAESREAARLAIMKKLADVNLPVNVVQVDGGAPDVVILDECKQRDIDLLVLCTHGRTGMDRFWMGSVAERVVQRAPCPVLTVHPETMKTDLPTVMLCTDLSRASWAGLPWAVLVARFFDVPLIVYSAIEDSLYLTQIGAGEKVVPVIREAEPLVQSRIEQHLEEARARGELDPDQEVEVCVQSSPDAWDAIVNKANDPAVGLVVIGTRGLTGLPHLFLGSTAQRVVRLSPTPVLSVHTSD